MRVRGLDAWYNPSYTLYVKTAISIPDPIFAAAEKVAAELAMSRSELYSKAVADFVSAYSSEAITEKINEVLATEPVELDPVLSRMQQEALRHSPW